MQRVMKQPQFGTNESAGPLRAAIERLGSDHIADPGDAQAPAEGFCNLVGLIARAVAGDSDRAARVASRGSR